MTKKPKSDYAIQAVSNALRLQLVFRDEAEIGVAELARRLGLPKNNVFRLLATLEELRFIEQSRMSGRYRLGIAHHELGQAYKRARQLFECAGPVLDQLLENTGETVHLAVRDGFEVVHVEARAPLREVRAGVRTGRRAPMHCTALGKVLLGCSPERLWREYDEQVVKRGRLPQRTERSIENPIKFFEQLRAVAGVGYAIDVGELEDGLGCTAAPIHDGDGELVAAVSVSAPLFRIGEEALVGDLRLKVRGAAEQLSAALGYNA